MFLAEQYRSRPTTGRALTSITHPNFREELIAAVGKMGYRA